MKINWINTIENLVWITLTIFAVTFILKPHMERQNELIEKLIERETYSYEIINEFNKKIKAKDGQIVIDLNSEQFVIPEDPDTIKQEPEKKGFFKRLFNLK